MKSYLSVPVKRTSVAVPGFSPTDTCIQYRPLLGAIIVEVLKLNILLSFTVAKLKLTTLLPEFEDVERAAQNEAPPIKFSA